MFAAWFLQTTQLPWPSIRPHLPRWPLLSCPHLLALTPTRVPLSVLFTEPPPSQASFPPQALSDFSDLPFPNVKSLNEVTLTGRAREGHTAIFPECRGPWLILGRLLKVSHFNSYGKAGENVNVA